MKLLDQFDDHGYNVTFIGSGNLAWHLAPALDNTDFAVKEVYSQTRKHAAALAERLYQAEVKVTLDFSNSVSRIFIMAVSDDVIQEIAGELILPQGAVLVHTSGSQPLSALGYAHTHLTGVFYPLQTFSKSHKIDFKEVPVLVESESKETEALLVKMAKAISKKVIKVKSEQRKAIHVAAVFASNFSNHMFTIAEEILKEQKLDLELLKPLIVATINKSLSIGPAQGQTGPARRGDLEVLDKHLQFLAHDPALAEIYRVVSQHIIDRYNE